MEDPGEWAEPWPYWKFGLKQNDLHDSLHIKYNTISSAIQDPEAFHHDVYELSTRADTLSEFEQLMEERKALRLKELNSMLEDASFQIVGCPRLIGTDQWPLAVQLFRTRSLDSLVRYFASYLPDEHPWYRESDSAGSNASSPVSPVDYADYDGPILFDEPEDDETFYTNEPSESFSTCGTAVDLADFADSPARSNTIHSIDSGVSVSDRKQRNADHESPSQTMSVSESESDRMAASLLSSIPTLNHDDEKSESEESETPLTSTSDVSESSTKRRVNEVPMMIVDDEDAEGFLSISRTHLEAMDTMDSDTPTPKVAAARSPAAPATPLFETKISPLRTRSMSSNRSHPHHAHHNHVAHPPPRNRATARHLRRRDGSIEPERPGRVQGGRTSRGRELSPEGMRSRARARRRRAGA